MALDVVSQSRCFDGTQLTYQHQVPKQEPRCDFFTAFVPLQAAHGALPVVWYLSGLTCTEENFTVKAGAQRIAANSGSCWLRLTQARAGMEYRGTRRAHTISDWAPAFMWTQRNRRGPGITEWRVT